MSDTPSPAPEPTRRTTTFIDGQNLFGSAREAFARKLPDFDPLKLSEKICEDKRWQLKLVRFFTGVPKRTDSHFWHIYWTAKNRGLSKDKVKVFTTPTLYRRQEIELPQPGETQRADGARFLIDGMPMPPGTQLFLPSGKTVPGKFDYLVGIEKGIDVRIALDLVQGARLQEYDVAVIFSQDQDLAQAVNDAKLIAREQKRSIELYSAFPVSDAKRDRAPIGGTTAIPISWETYEKCMDPKDYRPHYGRK